MLTASTSCLKARLTLRAPQFSHVKPSETVPPTTASVSSSSVVSSESESEGEINEIKAGAYASLAKVVPPKVLEQQKVPMNSTNPFLSDLPVAAPGPSPAQQQGELQQQQQQQSQEKKKKKRKKSAAADAAVAPGDNIFDIKPSDTQTPASATSPQKPQKKKSKVAKEQPTKTTGTAPTTPCFRDLSLPIASFSIPASSQQDSGSDSGTSPRRPSPRHEPTPPAPSHPLPSATPLHTKWRKAVEATRNDDAFANSYNFKRNQTDELGLGISTPTSWITAKPYGQWCASHPAAIAIDCEMCETKCPTTGKVDSKALCRLSVVNADNPSEVLLDTLVKPAWPVSDYRTFVNGISKADLEGVQFTLEHAQTFMKALCSLQTIVVGHAVHNDLMALKIVHQNVIDTAMLYTYVNPDDGTPSLKNLAKGVLGKEMPNVHDSVNDARVALECATNYVVLDGKVAPVEKVYTRSRATRGEDSANMLLVHRLPTSTLPEHLSEMFLAYTSIKPNKVPDIVFSGSFGKCNVEFTSREHAELAYVTLNGEEREDKGGKKQKRVSLKGGGYVCVRKMKKS